MRHYMVMLRLNIGGYEKMSHVMIQAENSEDAGAYAQYSELHNTDEDRDWTPNSTCWDDFMTYDVYETKEVVGHEVQCLKQFFNVHTFNMKDLKEAGYSG